MSQGWRAQTGVLNLPLTVCSRGKSVFSPDLNVRICEMGVGPAPDHLVWSRQALAVTVASMCARAGTQTCLIAVSDHCCQLSREPRDGCV